MGVVFGQYNLLNSQLSMSVLPMGLSLVRNGCTAIVSASKSIALKADDFHGRLQDGADGGDGTSGC